jgi:hypothetical protein
MTGGDGLGEGVGDLQPRQVVVDIRLEVERAPLDLLQHRGRGQQLAHRPDVEPGPLRVHRRAALQIGVPVALRMDDIVVRDQHEHPAGHAVLRHHLNHGRIRGGSNDTKVAHDTR